MEMTCTAPHILVADDQIENLVILEELLGENHKVHVAQNGQQVLDYLAAEQQVDLILLDVMMPHLDGFEACRRLKLQSWTRDIPVLFLTSLESPADEEYGLSLGAEDFIRKPFSPTVVLARVRNQLKLAHVSSQLRERNQDLERMVDERAREIVRQAEELVHSKQDVIAAQGAIITAFCALVEARDNETGNHLRRTQNYVRALAERLQNHPRFCHELNDDTIRILYKSAPLHDIGKVAIPDAILLKPGPLTPQEWEIMKQHARFGHDAILSAELELGESATFLRYSREIAYSHHEHWDGSGYPQGLAGEEIPISARLMAVADVYDALISARVYKPAFPCTRAFSIIAQGRGTHFDPDVVDALMTITWEFQEISQRFSDEEEMEFA